MAAPSLSSFASELRTRNISRPNQYYVEIFTPPTLQSSARLVSAWCSGASTPFVSISTQDDYIEAGTRRKFAYDQDYQNLVLTFYVDQAFDVKKFFDDWKSKIVPTKRNFNYPDDYTAEKLNVWIINSAGKPTYLYAYKRVFPKTINSMELSYSSSGTYSTLAVEFVFEEVHDTQIDNGEAEAPSKSTLNTTKNPLTGILNPELKQALTPKA